MRRRVLLVAAVVALVLSIGAGASAYLSASGSGSGSASTGSMQTVTVTAVTGGDAPSNTLLPGGSADVILRVDNPNAYAVALTSVTAGPGAISTAQPGCTGTGGVTFTDQSGLSDTIAASGTTLVHLTDAATMATSSPDACQGAAFSIPVTITVQAP